MNKILFFSSSSCGPCNLAKKQLSEDVINDLGITIVNVSAENDFEMFAKFQVASVPTFISVDENDIEIKRKIGFKSIQDIKELV